MPGTDVLARLLEPRTLSMVFPSRLRRLCFSAFMPSAADWYTPLFRGGRITRFSLLLHSIGRTAREYWWPAGRSGGGVQDSAARPRSPGLSGIQSRFGSRAAPRASGVRPTSWLRPAAERAEQCGPSRRPPAPCSRSRSGACTDAATGRARGGAANRWPAKGRLALSESAQRVQQLLVAVDGRHGVPPVVGRDLGPAVRCQPVGLPFAAYLWPRLWQCSGAPYAPVLAYLGSSALER